jgi:hypothetical protein
MEKYLKPGKPGKPLSRLAVDQLVLTQFKGAEAMVSSALVKRHDTLGHQEAA